MDRNKVILTDCDGVLLDWISPFEEWMLDRGYKVKKNQEYSLDKRFGISFKKKEELVKTFNESAQIGFLPAWNDSIHYVKKLHEKHGYVFHCITSLGKNKYAQALRIRQLRNMFGSSVFEKITILDTAEDKREALREYAGTGCWWIEDNVENAMEGSRQNLTPILMLQDYNTNQEALKYRSDIMFSYDWKDAYQIIMETGIT